MTPKTVRAKGTTGDQYVAQGSISEEVGPFMELADFVVLGSIVAGMAIAVAVYAASARCEKRQIPIWLILNAIAILALWLTTPWVSGVPVALASYMVVIAGLGQRLRRNIRHS